MHSNLLRIHIFLLYTQLNILFLYRGEKQIKDKILMFKRSISLSSGLRSANKNQGQYSFSNGTLELSYERTVRTHTKAYTTEAENVTQCFSDGLGNS